MYQRSYGETHFPDGLRRGPRLRPHLRQPRPAERAAGGRGPPRRSPARTPARVIRPGTLEDYAAVVWPRRAELPVVELELGDSWIHGTASDPVKLARFRALQRLYDTFAAEGLDARAPRLRPRPHAGRRAHLGRRHQELPARRGRLGPPRPRGGARRRPPLRLYRGLLGRAARLPRRRRRRARARRPRPRRGGAGRDRGPSPGQRHGPRRPSSTLDGWRIEIAPDTGDVRAITSPAARARGPRRPAHRLPPRELRRRRRGAAHGDATSPTARNGPSSTTTSPASPAPPPPAPPPSRRSSAERPATPSSPTCRPRPPTRSARRPRVELAFAPDGRWPPPHPRACATSPPTGCPRRASSPSAPRAPPTGASSRPASGSRPSGSRPAAAATCRRSSPPPPRSAGRTIEIVPLDTALVAPEGGDFMAFDARAARLRPGHPLQPLQQQVGHQLPHVVGGHAQARFLLRA